MIILTNGLLISRLQVQILSGAPQYQLVTVMSHCLFVAGRLPVLRVVMFGSAIIGIILGFSATFIFPIVLCLLILYGITVTADSATITAGVVDVADPRFRGTVMATYSLIGFLGASIGPVVFGLMLDLGGGESSSLGWKLAFSSLAAMVCIGPIAVAQGQKHL